MESSLPQSTSSSLIQPAVTLQEPIPQLANTRNLTIAINVIKDPSVSVRNVSCQLDTGVAINCTSLSASFPNIMDGDHRISIVAEDSANQRSAEFIALFRIDATAPTVVFNQTPQLATQSTTASFLFTANDALSGVSGTDCSMDGSAYSPCTSPVNFASLTAGSHIFNVRARDLAGNQSAISSFSWTISSGAPTITITQRPNSVVNTASASFSFSGTDNGQAMSVFECSVNNGAFSACTSPINLTGLSNGSHQFSVQGRTASGNFSSPATYSWVIDSVSPSAPILTNNILASLTRLSSVTFNFSAIDNTGGSGIGSYQCSLDGGGFSTCSSPRVLSSLVDGAHNLIVRAVDNAGNISPTAVSNWTVDSQLPVINITQSPQTSTTETTANFSFTVLDTGSGLLSTECSLDTGAYSACANSISYTGLSIATHSFSIRASDRAGNQRVVTHNWTISSIGDGGSGSGGLIIDLSYVNPQSPQFLRLKTVVDDAILASSDTNPNTRPDYGFEPQHAAYVYRVLKSAPGSNPLVYNRYCDYAIQFAENCPNSYNESYNPGQCGVQNAEATIAAGGRPFVSGDSYLEVGPIIGSLAITYDWCADRMTAAQRTRWENYARQAIYNVWHPNQATWGGRLYPWTGWSIDNPGNNYFYSFTEATMYWALASRDSQMLALATEKMNLLQNYYRNIPGGGSLEGTGYGTAHMRLFQLYQVWKDSTGIDLANANSHLTDSIRFWMHATTPNRRYYTPVGDLSRESFPNLFDYHRRLILEARRLTNNTAAQTLASWWLNKISVTQMSRRIDSQWDLLPAGSESGTAPNEPFSYRATGVGRVFARTGWDTSALWMTFNAGPYVESHAHQDQGSFALANGEWLSVTNNIYIRSGINQTSDYHNVLRFVQNGSIIPQREGTASTMTVNQLSANGDLDVTGNLRPAYGSSTAIGSWTRNVRFVTAERKLTVTDNFSVTGGTQAIFQLHVPVQPTINGNQITAGTLRVTVTNPANPAITFTNLGGYRIDISGGTTGYTVELTDR